MVFGYARITRREFSFFTHMLNLLQRQIEVFLNLGNILE